MTILHNEIAVYMKKRKVKLNIVNFTSACRQKGLRIEIIFIVKSGVLLSSCQTLRASPLYETVCHNDSRLLTILIKLIGAEGGRLLLRTHSTHST